jgi:hypothetical protein
MKQKNLLFYGLLIPYAILGMILLFMALFLVLAILFLFLPHSIQTSIFAPLSFLNSNGGRSACLLGNCNLQNIVSSIVLIVLFVTSYLLCKKLLKSLYLKSKKTFITMAVAIICFIILANLFPI